MAASSSPTRFGHSRRPDDAWLAKQAKAVLWNAFKRITAGCSADEKLALFSGTAKRLYRVD